MWTQLFDLQVPLAEKVLRTVVIYGLIVVLVRLAGKRGLASMNVLDFVVLFLLAGVVENATIGNDTSVSGGIVSAVTLVVVNGAFSRLINAFPALQRILEGKPTTVIEHGEVVKTALRKLGMRTSELDHAVRSQNGDSIEEIEHGQLTPSGQIVVSLKPEEQSATKADAAALEHRLQRIEELLSERR